MDFGSIRAARKAYLHYWNTPQERTAKQAVEAYASATRLILGVMNVKILNGNISLNPKLRRYLGGKGDIVSRRTPNRHHVPWTWLAPASPSNITSPSARPAPRLEKGMVTSPFSGRPSRGVHPRCAAGKGSIPAQGQHKIGGTTPYASPVSRPSATPTRPPLGRVPCRPGRASRSSTRALPGRVPTRRSGRTSRGLRASSRLPARRWRVAAQPRP